MYETHLLCENCGDKRNYSFPRGSVFQGPHETIPYEKGCDYYELDGSEMNAWTTGLYYNNLETIPGSCILLPKRKHRLVTTGIFRNKQKRVSVMVFKTVYCENCGLPALHQANTLWDYGKNILRGIYP